MAYLNLQARPPYNLSEADHEDQMPTHVIWGEVESVSRVASSVSSSDLGSHTESRKKKLKNKRLNYIPQNRELLPQHIQFRGSDDSGSNLSRTPEISEDILHRGSASSDTSSEIQKDTTQVGPVALDKTPANHASNQWRMESMGADNSNDGEDSEANCEIEVFQSQQPQANVANVSPAELEEWKGKVRLNSQGLPTSIGSAGHDRDCRPCLFVWTKVGCLNGVLCIFCHFPHRRGTKPRPCKDKRSRYRKLMNRMEQLVDAQDGPQTVESNKPKIPSRRLVRPNVPSQESQERVMPR